MFDQLFNCRQTVVRHESAPLLEERICYLQDCRDVGSPRGTLRRKAHELLVIVKQMNLPPGAMIVVADATVCSNSAVITAQMADWRISRSDRLMKAIAHKGSHDHCKRVSIKSYAESLRAFFRYAESQGWCRSGLATAIMAPRTYPEEILPQGPSWEAVQQVLASTRSDRSVDIRDRAIVMLFMVYGLRSGEVQRLQLEDLDWKREVIRIVRPKSRRSQEYPLTPTVGEAILRHLKEVRLCRPSRHVFLTLHAPHSPLSRSSLWKAVCDRLRPLNPSIQHYGPRALRHACATHLLSQGLPLKEIGDHLGHRSAASTRVYAKVDLAGLREVSNFDLGDLL